MPHHRRKLLPICIAASLLSGLSAPASAVGVGDIELRSFLGSPLQAEIPLNHLGDLTADQLKVQLGSQSDYGAMGVDYTYQHSQLKIEPFVRNGQGYVRVSTHEPITEPYLNFVLSLRWPQGQLVREFTVLLDLPQAQTALAQSVAPSEALAASAPAAPEPVPRREPRTKAPVSAAPAVVMPDGGSYTIQRGDSLWRIANRVRPQGVPVEQVMAAIQARNPQAFINADPNLLKEATTIVLPDAAQIASADALPAAEPATSRGEVAAAVPAMPAAASPTVDAELVEENSALKAQVAELTGNVSALNENLAQSEQRLRQLESQLNQLVQQMQQQRATVAAMSGSEAAPETLAQSGGGVINQVNAAELNSAAAAHTPWWVHLLYWFGIGAAVTWAVREHFWPQRRLALATAGDATTPEREASPAAQPMARVAKKPAITTVEEAAELTLDFDELPTPAPAREEQAASAAGEAAPQLLRSSEEPVDVSISAGVFVAFGRFSEAERLLRDAIARDPSRTDLKLQLLDVLMQSDQPGAFDDLAAEIESEARSPETLAELAVLRDSYRPR